MPLLFHSAPDFYAPLLQIFVETENLFKILVHLHAQPKAMKDSEVIYFYVVVKKKLIIKHAFSFHKFSRIIQKKLKDYQYRYAQIQHKRLRKSDYLKIQLHSHSISENRELRMYRKHGLSENFAKSKLQTYPCRYTFQLEISIG